MEIGITANVLRDKLFDETLAYSKKLGIQTVEPGHGDYMGGTHVNPEMLFASKAEPTQFRQQLKDSGLTASTLSCHGNPIHPNAEMAMQCDSDTRNAALLCEQPGLNTIICFSGCAGDHPGIKYPNWITCPWSDDYLKILEYQWNSAPIPYWKDFIASAKVHGITKVMLELHPGFMVYNSETLKRLRGVVGPEIGVNSDLSHLVWQGMGSAAVLWGPEESIFRVHVKSLKIDPTNHSVSGILDIKHYSDELNRS